MHRNMSGQRCSASCGRVAIRRHCPLGITSLLYSPHCMSPLLTRCVPALSSSWKSVKLSDSSIDATVTVANGSQSASRSDASWARESLMVLSSAGGHVLRQSQSREEATSSCFSQKKDPMRVCIQVQMKTSVCSHLFC